MSTTAQLPPCVRCQRIGISRPNSLAGAAIKLEILQGGDDVSEGTFEDQGIEDGARLSVLMIGIIAFSYVDEGVVLSHDSHVATSHETKRVGCGNYLIAVADTPFESSGRQIQRMKVVEKKRNVIIGAIAAEGHDIARALSSHSNRSYDYGYIGNGPNGWVYDSDGDLSHNGRQLNSWGARNVELRSGDIIDMTLDMEQRTLSFVVNGVLQPSCFENIHADIPIYFAVAFGAAGESVELTPGIVYD